MVPILTPGRQDFEGMLHVGTGWLRVLGADTQGTLEEKCYLRYYRWFQGPTSQGCWPTMETNVLWRSTCFDSNLCTCYIKTPYRFHLGPKAVFTGFQHTIGTPRPPAFPHPLPNSANPPNQSSFIKYYVSNNKRAFGML